MSYFHQQRRSPLDDKLLHEHLDKRAQETPSKEALVYYDENMGRSALSFSEFRDESVYVARALLELGVRRGNRVALMLPNGLECAVSCMALHRLGAVAILVPLGDIRPAQLALLTRIKCSGIIRSLDVDNRQAGQVTRATIELAQVKAPDGSAQVKAIVTTGANNKENCLNQDKGDRMFSYQEIVELGKKLDFVTLQKAQAEVDPRDPVAVVFTSGSTGEPKAVTFTQHAIGNSMSSGSFKADDRYFMARPMVWISGFTLLSAVPVAGLTLVLVPSERLLQDKGEMAFTIIQDEHCTSANLLQNLLYKLINEKLQKKYDLSSLRSFGVGGQRIPQSLIANVIELLPGIRSLLVYGCTETLLVSLQPISKENVHSDDYGKMFILPGVEVKIVDKDGAIIPKGAIGEVCVRGQKTFLEYLDDPVATSKAKSSSGWVNTGDLGTLDEKNKLQILGRKREVIKHNTRLVFPIEVEKVLMRHPDISQAIAFGVPDMNTNEEICACVVRKSSETRNVNELEAWCEQKFAPGPDGLSLKPRYTIVMDKFPQTGNGKDDRRAVRQLALREINNKSTVTKKTRKLSLEMRQRRKVYNSVLLEGLLDPPLKH